MSWDDRYERFEKRPYRTGWIWGLGILGTVILAGIILTIVGFASGWGHKAVEIVSPKNVEDQFNRVTRNWEALTKAADNACLAQTAASQDSNSPVLVENPVMAYAATYRGIRADYNAAQENIFKAKIAGPPGYPDEIPNYPEAIGATPDFCSVSSHLADLRG